MFEFYKLTHMLRKHGCKNIMLNIIGDKRFINFGEDQIVFSDGIGNELFVIMNENTIDFISSENDREKVTTLSFIEKNNTNYNIKLELIESYKENDNYTAVKYCNELYSSQKNGTFSQMPKLVSSKSEKYVFKSCLSLIDELGKRNSSVNKIKIKK